MKGGDPISLATAVGQFAYEYGPRAHEWAKDTFGTGYAFHPDAKSNMPRSRNRPSYQFGGTPKPKTLTVNKKSQVRTSKNLAQPSSKKQKQGASDVFQTRNQHVIGENATLVGDSNETPITMRLGANVNPSDSIKNLFSHINGRGTVSSTWAGQIVSALDKRSYIFQHFRHRLHDTASPTVDAAYPTNAIPYIMKPTAADITLDSKTVTDFPMHLHASGDETFCPINRPALEDMSWNLNQLKLMDPVASANYNARQSGRDANWLAQVNKVKLNWTSGDEYMRADSVIYQNNGREPDHAAGITRNFKYDSVIKTGTVEYIFMNKGEAPIEVEIIVYRAKKQGLAQSPVTFEPTGGLNKSLKDPIAKGYLEKRVNAFGTVNVAGRVPLQGDCITEARFPFLPQTSKIKQSECAFVEDRRVKFVMQSGARRPFVIQLGGDVYDPFSVPNNTANTTETGTDAPAVTKPYLDSHSYTLAIATNGVKTSREVDSTETGANKIAGDCHAPACLQYYCKYTEKVGACRYQYNKSAPLYVNGFMKDLGDAMRAQSIHQDAVVLVPQQTAIRTSDGRGHVGADTHQMAVSN